MQRSHPFKGPLSEAHAPLVVAGRECAARQPAPAVVPVQSQAHVWVQPSVARTKLRGRQVPEGPVDKGAAVVTGAAVDGGLCEGSGQPETPSKAITAVRARSMESFYAERSPASMRSTPVIARCSSVFRRGRARRSLLVPPL